MRSITCSLLALLAAGCPGTASDKDSAAGDTSATGIDVSGLVCAGFEDPEGEILVPRTSTDGCEGAALSGTLTCLECAFGVESVVKLHAVWITGDPSRGLTCASTAVTPSGQFDFGLVAPFSSYSLDISGNLSNGYDALFVEGVPQFAICSDDVWIEAEVEIPDDEG